MLGSILKKNIWVAAGLSFLVSCTFTLLLRYGAIISLLAGIAGAGLVLASSLLYRRSKEKKAALQEEADPDALVRDPHSEYDGIESVVHLFLDIFRHQSKAKMSDEAEFVLLDSPNNAMGLRYELRVKRGEQWLTRNITVGEIGEPGTSKSQCYHVIFDKRLVVKVPPKPISSLQKYTESVAKETSIVERLAPRECLVPTVSLILDKLVSAEDEADFETEEEALAWFETAEKYHPYFKIGDGFIYFMDLAKYFFLSRGLDEIHDKKSRFYKEALRDPDIVLEPFKFEDRYGDEDLGYALQKMYLRYEPKVKQLIARNPTRSSASIHSQKYRQWFFLRLAGRKVSAADAPLPENFLAALNRMLEQMENDNRQTVKTYRTLVRKHVEIQYLNLNLSSITSISSNILDLLGWLHQKKVSIRDLKPDNLLLTGNPDDYPEFMKYPGEFQIGLIDVETAVDYSMQDGQPVVQPLLGGTPIFATPLHFLPNSAIESFYGDLPRILHLQDWYAAIGMIYKVVTGDHLFQSAPGIFPTTVQTLQTAMHQNAISEDVVEQVGREFWQGARRDMEEKIKSQKTSLTKAEILVPENARPPLLELSEATSEYIDRDLKRLIVSQKLFDKKNMQNGLYKASADEIAGIGKKWVKAKGPTASPKVKAYASELFRKLLHYKKQAALQKSFQAALDDIPPQVAALVLLEALFDIAFVHMHQRIWGVVYGAKPAVRRQAAAGKTATGRSAVAERTM